MKEFRQHQPTFDKNTDVDGNHMYKFLYMIGDNEWFISKDILRNIGITRHFRKHDSKLIVLLTTN